MLNEEMQKLVIAALTVIIICATVATCSSAQNISDNKAVVSMVEKGADPMIAACSIGRGTELKCSLAISNQSK